jgi:hypothetical protein
VKSKKIEITKKINKPNKNQSKHFSEHEIEEVEFEVFFSKRIKNLKSESTAMKKVFEHTLS